MTNRVFIHVDINSAYCSMEAFWNPKLKGKPCVVLSSNDGTIIARSAEAKLLKIPMGAPLFKVQDIINKHNVHVLSSNFALYGEMSRRFHGILSGFVDPSCYSIYSIDEGFIEFTQFTKNFDATEMAREIRHQVYKFIGLTTCVGVGRTLTESKMANNLAKKNPELNGICNLVTMSLVDVESYYQSMPVDEIWGVGRKYAKKLNDMGILTVLDLATSNPNRMRELFNVNMQSTILELLGQPCFEFESSPKAKQQIVSSKSFGQKITELSILQEAISKYTHNAFNRLVDEHQLCGSLIVFLQSNPFDQSKPYYSKSLTYTFTQPTNNLMQLVKAATSLIDKLYKEGIEFKKCGVMLCELIKEEHRTIGLLTDVEQLEKEQALMTAFQSIQSKFGKAKIAAGSCNLKNRDWEPKSERQSRNYFSEAGMIVFN